MTIEHSNHGSRAIGTFPGHWQGIYPGQHPAERAAIIIENIATDRELNGDRRGAEEIRQAYRTAGASRRSAAEALARVRRSR